MDETRLDETRRLGDERYVSLATFRRDGRAVETPVWVAEHAGRLYVFSEARAWKVKRLRRDARVRVSACNVRGLRRGPAVPGRGRIVSEPEIVAAAYRAFDRKYGLQMKLANLLSRLSGRYDRRAMLELELSPDAHAA